MQFSIDYGVLSLLSNANNQTKPHKEFTFYLSGDLSQMASQERFFRSNGFEVSRSNVYPILKEEDVPKALKLLFDYKADGWWHYHDEYVKHQICTSEDFHKAFNNYAGEDSKK